LFTSLTKNKTIVIDHRSLFKGIMLWSIMGWKVAAMLLHLTTFIFKSSALSLPDSLSHAPIMKGKEKMVYVGDSVTIPCQQSMKDGMPELHFKPDSGQDEVRVFTEEKFINGHVHTYDVLLNPWNNKNVVVEFLIKSANINNSGTYSCLMDSGQGCRYDYHVRILPKNGSSTHAPVESKNSYDSWVNSVIVLGVFLFLAVVAVIALIIIIVLLVKRRKLNYEQSSLGKDATSKSDTENSGLCRPLENDTSSYEFTEEMRKSVRDKYPTVSIRDSTDWIPIFLDEICDRAEIRCAIEASLSEHIRQQGSNMIIYVSGQSNGVEKLVEEVGKQMGIPRRIVLETELSEYLTQDNKQNEIDPRFNILGMKAMIIDGFLQRGVLDRTKTLYRFVNCYVPIKSAMAVLVAINPDQLNPYVYPLLTVDVSIDSS
jgi:hypothetical protein